ncbi:hypothetical protein SAMN05421790_103176 [Kroppenstedtia eburnea]|uniref:Uncharacterized protein n=1 Tax=Kroppenstedtia eburnea TaxID=714067 RepID=A0A1N7KN77_9BACL|nr:hypothetical protein SAMN05421790_103176 [Kroppenstedtia eburnea]
MVIIAEELLNMRLEQLTKLRVILHNQYFCHTDPSFSWNNSNPFYLDTFSTY